MSTEHYLTEKLERYDPVFFLVQPYLPEAQQTLMQALWMLRQEFRTLLRDCSDFQVVHNKISWWLEEWQRAADHKARHPVTRGLSGQAADGIAAAKPESVAFIFAHLYTETVETAGQWVSYIRSLSELLAGIERSVYQDADVSAWEQIVCSDLLVDSLYNPSLASALMPLDILAQSETGREQFASNPKDRQRVVKLLSARLNKQLKSVQPVQSVSYIYAAASQDVLRHLIKAGEASDSIRWSTPVKIWRRARRVKGLRP